MKRVFLQISYWISIIIKHGSRVQRNNKIHLVVSRTLNIYIYIYIYMYGMEIFVDPMEAIGLLSFSDSRVIIAKFFYEKFVTTFYIDLCVLISGQTSNNS